MANLFNREEEKLINLLKELKSEFKPDFDFIRVARITILDEFEKSKLKLEHIPIWAQIASAIPSFALRIALVLVLIFGLAGGIAFASQKALPNDILYPVKLATEKTKLALAPNEVSRARLRVEFAETRLQEVDAIGSQSKFNLDAVMESITRFNNEIKNLHEDLYRIQNSKDQKEVFSSLYAIENKLNSGIMSLEDLGEKINARVSGDNIIASTLEQSQDAAELELIRTEDIILELQRRTARLDGEDQRRQVRILRKALRAEARLAELDAAFAESEAKRIEALRRSQPTIAFEADEVEMPDSQRQIFEKLQEARRLLEFIKANSGDAAKYLLLIERLRDFEDLAALIESELEK